MRRFVCPLATVLMWTAASTSAAFPGVPPVRIDAPNCIRLVGCHLGTPATALGQFQVRVKDIANNPLPNAPVLIDLSQCADLRLSTDQHDPGAVVNCQARTLRKLTDGTGTVTFTLLGGSTGYALGGPTTLPGQAKIYVPPYLDYGVTVSASAFDLDAILGVSAGDLSSWLKDFASGMPWARSDYDCSGSIGASDLSLWLEAFASGAMDETCGSVCP